LRRCWLEGVREVKSLDRVDKKMTGCFGERNGKYKCPFAVLAASPPSPVFPMQSRMRSLLCLSSLPLHPFDAPAVSLPRIIKHVFSAVFGIRKHTNVPIWVHILSAGQVRPLTEGKPIPFLAVH